MRALLIHIWTANNSPSSAYHRTTQHAVLLAGAAVPGLHDEAARRGLCSEYGKRLADVAGTGQAITAHFSDGTRDSVGVLIGVDGIRSTIRALIDPAAPQSRYTSLLNFGARVNAPDWPPPATRRTWSSARPPPLVRHRRWWPPPRSGFLEGSQNAFVTVLRLRR
jgi:2-polyprenyl-6-methoxyphenol hydroxylase-like FAD-dependent oxidoreductase